MSLVTTTMKLKPNFRRQLMTLRLTILGRNDYGSRTKEIRTQIASIQNTQKITSAMEMVAASKMKKAQNRMRASRPYSEKIA